MKTPIIVQETAGSVIIFESKEDAEKYLEPIDVENGEYIAYDAEGRLLEIIPTEPRVTITHREIEPRHADELRSILAEFLVHVDKQIGFVAEMPLNELIERSLRYRK